jgi:seryl-tRNA synthetase
MRNEQIRPLQKRLDEIAEESADLRASLEDEDVREAKKRVLSREIDDALAAGKTSVAETKRQEITAIDARVREVHEKESALWTESREIHNKIGRIGVEIFRANWPAVRQAAHDKWKELVDFLDAEWADLQAFGGAANVQLSINLHRDGLAPLDSLTSDKALKKRVEFWA